MAAQAQQPGVAVELGRKRGVRHGPGGGYRPNSARAFAVVRASTAARSRPSAAPSAEAMPGRKAGSFRSPVRPRRLVGSVGLEEEAVRRDGPGRGLRPARPLVGERPGEGEPEARPGVGRHLLGAAGVAVEHAAPGQRLRARGAREERRVRPEAVEHHREPVLARQGELSSQDGHLPVHGRGEGPRPLRRRPVEPALAHPDRAAAGRAPRPARRGAARRRGGRARGGAAGGCPGRSARPARSSPMSASPAQPTGPTAGTTTSVTPAARARARTRGGPARRPPASR